MDRRLKREGDRGGKIEWDRQLKRDKHNVGETQWFWHWDNEKEGGGAAWEEVGRWQRQKVNKDTRKIDNRFLSPPFLSSALFHSQYWIAAVNSSPQRILERCIWFVAQHAVERGGQHLIYEPGTFWSGSTRSLHLSATSQHLKFNNLSDCYVDLCTSQILSGTMQTLFGMLGKNGWEMPMRNALGMRVRWENVQVAICILTWDMSHNSIDVQPCRCACTIFESKASKPVGYKSNKTHLQDLARVLMQSECTAHMCIWQHVFTCMCLELPFNTLLTDAQRLIYVIYTFTIIIFLFLSFLRTAKCWWVCQHVSPYEVKKLKTKATQRC